ncbi:MAG TPA: lysophospholipid acyltransferase family protein [Polyangiaceae bacterium]|nr:lysophospholipid acyltransferase family protein [Polyangiaceae bacterium]
MWIWISSVFRQLAMVVWHLVWNLTALALWVLPFFWDGRHYFFMARRGWAPGLLWLGGSPPTFSGHDKIDWSKPHVIVANHQGNADIPLLMMAVDAPLRFLAKRSVAYIPVIGWILVLARFPFIDRDNAAKGKRSIEEVARRIREERLNVVVFPEGTRSPEGTMLPFKKGAFVLAIQAQVPIVPVALEGSGAAMPRASFRIYPHPMKVTVGDPIPTEGMTMHDREALRVKAEEAMLAMLRWKRIKPAELEQARAEEKAARERQAA